MTGFVNIIDKGIEPALHYADNEGILKKLLPSLFS